MVICEDCGKVLDPHDPAVQEKKVCMACVLNSTPGSLPLVGQKAEEKLVKPDDENQIPTSMDVWISKFDYRYMVIFRHTVNQGPLEGKYFEFGITRQQLESLLKQIAERKKEDDKKEP